MLTGQGQPADDWQIEAHAAQAWPATGTRPLGGWLVRHTPGVLRRRSNSMLPPLADGPGRAGGPDGNGAAADWPASFEQAVAGAEDFYARLGLPAAVQVTPAWRQGSLDAFLDQRGYARVSPTLVLTARAPAVAVSGPGGPPGDVVVADRLDPEWASAYASLDGRADSDEVAERVIGRISLPVACVRLIAGAEIAGVGLFVGGGRYAGAFCVATAPAWRRQGVARAIMAAGARWAVQHGGQRLYLQVEEGNAAARALYARAGFAVSHGYHYRIASPAGR